MIQTYSNLNLKPYSQIIYKSLYSNYTSFNHLINYHHITNLINNKSNYLSQQYKQLLLIIDQTQFLFKTYHLKIATDLIKKYSHHYRYHINVPNIFIKQYFRSTDKYWSQKLKLYYKQIKKQLKLTVTITKTEKPLQTQFSEDQIPKCSCVLCQLTKKEQSTSILRKKQSQSKTVEQVLDNLKNVKEKKYLAYENFNDFILERISESGKKFEQYLKKSVKRNSEQKMIIIKNKKIIQGNDEFDMRVRETYRLPNLIIKQEMFKQSNTFKNFIKQKLSYRNTKIKKIAQQEFTKRIPMSTDFKTYQAPTKMLKTSNIIIKIRSKSKQQMNLLDKKIEKNKILSVINLRKYDLTTRGQKTPLKLKTNHK